MFVYEKKLQYPVNIKQTNAKLAKIIITQYGGAYSKTYKKQAVRYKSATACCFDINYLKWNKLRNLHNSMKLIQFYHRYGEYKNLL